MEEEDENKLVSPALLAPCAPLIVREGVVAPAPAGHRVCLAALRSVYFLCYMYGFHSVDVRGSNS